MVIDLLEKQKIFYELASIVLKERYPGVRTAQKMKFSIEDFFSKVRFLSRFGKRIISSRVSNEKVTEITMDASWNVISAL